MATGGGFAAPWVEFEELLGFRPALHGPTIENIFKAWDAMGAKMVAKLTFPAPDPSVTTEDRTIANGIKIRIYHPPGFVRGSKPICFYIHSGGWAMGDLDGDDPICRNISKRNSVAVVSVDYRLAPQFQYPAGLDDCSKAFEWTIENAVDLGGLPGKAIIAGGSAGGGSAFAVALRLIDAGKESQVVGVVSQVPCLIHPDLVTDKTEYTSYDENDENTVNSKSAMLTFWDAYGAPKGDKYANPILHPALGKLPRVYLNACDKDTLLDDARMMKKILEKAGVPTRYDEFKGYPHFYWTFAGPSLTDAIEDYYQHLTKGVDFVLESENGIKL